LWGLLQCRASTAAVIFLDELQYVDRATRAAREAGVLFKILDDGGDGEAGKISISTMRLAKGLEFRAVAVMVCDDEVLPLQERIETVGDDADLQEVYDTERQLLYVACTRIRDSLLVASVEPASEFLDDLRRGTVPKGAIQRVNDAAWQCTSSLLWGLDPTVALRPWELYHSYHFRPNYHQGIGTRGNVCHWLNGTAPRGKLLARQGFRVFAPGRPTRSR
jgi:UvrD-like helicase C-terminal domain